MNRPKKVLIFLLIICTNLLKAQTTYNIKFQHGLTWAQVKAKAKQENKYIFVDGYTTWCAPCRFMANEIFTQKEVADFINENFINVSVQFDVTKKDAQWVKEWYHDAEDLKQQYKIDSYPTYLFFTPDGTMIHSISGATKDGAEFIDKAKLSLNPKTQFATLKKDYDAGKRDSAFLVSLIKTTQLSNNSKFLPIVINDYLATQKNLLSDENLKYIISATNKTTDPGFSVLITNPGKVDEIGGKGTASGLISNILFDEIVLPLVRTNGKKTNYGGGMIVYSGDVIKNIDWNGIADTLNKKYPKCSEETLMAAKPVYYQWQTDWPNYVQSVVSYISKFQSDISYDKINSYAWTILANCEDKSYLDAAAGWSKITVSDNKLIKPYFI